MIRYVQNKRARTYSDKFLYFGPFDVEFSVGTVILLSFDYIDSGSSFAKTIHGF